MSVSAIVEGLLEHKFSLAQQAQDFALGRLHSDLVAKGMLRSGENVVRTKQVFELDIEARREAFIDVVKVCLPAIRREPADEALLELKDLARKWIGGHVDYLERELRELATRISLGDIDGLSLNADRVIHAIDAELGVILVPSAAKAEIHAGPVFIDSDRLQELRTIRSEQFDLARLVRLCEEADICYRNGCFHAVAMLTRAILDHIPPVFGFHTFREVANQYNGGKSFKEIAQQLENSARRIADSHLHVPIRVREVLPTQTQVNASQALDCILAEVVRLLSRKSP